MKKLLLALLFLIPLQAKALVVQSLIVAGGGGGGKFGAGGGAGGMVTSTASTVNGDVVVTVGSGGAGSTDTSVGPGSGTNSSFNGMTATGGGGGGDRFVAAQAGGSGGGGCTECSVPQAGAAGTQTASGLGAGFGNNGGQSPGNTWGGGGGGGAGAVGGDGCSNACTVGAGGAGLANSISGSSVFYAGGGGGSPRTDQSQNPGAGGNGGGGAGGTNGNAGTAGTANTGSGGGGGNFNGSFFNGGAGGSGVVIVSYSSAGGDGTGGTISHSGGNTIHTFTSSGTFSPPADTPTPTWTPTNTPSANTPTWTPTWTPTPSPTPTYTASPSATPTVITDKRGLKLKNTMRMDLGFLDRLMKWLDKFFTSTLQAAPQNQLAYTSWIITQGNNAFDSLTIAATTGCPVADFKYRILTFGSSIESASYCNNGNGDGSRSTLIQELFKMGFKAKYMGTQTSSYQSVMGAACQVTDAINGRTYDTVYGDLSNISSVITSPTANDWVLLGFVLTNDMMNGKTITQMTNGYYACLTKAAALISPGTVFFTNDIPRTDGDITPAITAATAVALSATSNNLTKVHFLNVSGTVTLGTADYCGGGDTAHLLPVGFVKVGTGMAQQINLYRNQL